MQAKSELAIGFVVYHPTDEFFRRLELAYSAGFKLYVFDNSPGQTNFSDILDKYSDIKYITAGKNLGLGVGLSVINATAYYEQYPRLVFFDQDTNFTVETLNYIYNFSCCKTTEYRTNYAAVVFSSLMEGSKLEYVVRDTPLVISSGSLFYLGNLKEINWHNENYFVDGVDYEMCLRARLKGYKVGVCYNTPGFDHLSEQPDKVVKFFNLSLPLRRYSITRIVDAIGAYIKLIITSTKSLDFIFSGIILRSCAIYVLGQFLSRIVVKKG